MDKLSENDISELEESLQAKLPDDVKREYLKSNGLLGPTNCHLLYKYKSEDSYDIEHINKSLKSEVWFPNSMSETMLLGDDGCGNIIGFNSRENVAILWNPEDGNWVQEKRATVTELWQYIRELYGNEA